MGNVSLAQAMVSYENSLKLSIFPQLGIFYDTGARYLSELHDGPKHLFLLRWYIFFNIVLRIDCLIFQGNDLINLFAHEQIEWTAKRFK